LSKEIIEYIARWAQLDEIYELVGKYTGYQGSEEITVEIYERPDGGQYRFSVHAYVTNDPSRHGHGNPERTIEDALSTYHWNDLSRR
jgi:hypothetical protein